MCNVLYIKIEVRYNLLNFRLYFLGGNLRRKLKGQASLQTKSSLEFGFQNLM